MGKTILIILFSCEIAFCQLTNNSLLLIVSHNRNNPVQNQVEVTPSVPTTQSVPPSAENKAKNIAVTGCTGFVIQDHQAKKKYAMSAGHCLISRVQTTQEVVQTEIAEAATIAGSQISTTRYHRAKGSPLNAHEESDIAILGIPGEAFTAVQALQLAKNSPQLGDRLFVMGYDRGQRVASAECVSAGSMLFDLSHTANYRNIYPTMECPSFSGELVHSGMSGSPVVNESGHVVGVLVIDAGIIGSTSEVVSKGVMAITPLSQRNFDFDSGLYTPESDTGVVDLPVYDNLGQSLRATGQLKNGRLEGPVRVYNLGRNQSEWYQFENGRPAGRIMHHPNTYITNR